MEECKIKNLYNLEETIAKDFLEKLKYPWEALPKISEYILELGGKLDSNIYELKGDNIWIAKSAKIMPSVYIKGPAIIGENSEIRHCAFIRENVLIGNNVVVGNSTELKNVILFNGVAVPHYNYVGDSILGYKVHLGASAITSNIKNDQSTITVRNNAKEIKTSLVKFGAMIGDNSEIGCGSVLNPGTVIGKNASIYPLSCVRGVLQENTIYKNKNEIVNKI